MPIPIPSLPEQTAIATVLSDTDALLGSLDTLLTKKRNLKQATMQRLLKPGEGWVVKRLGEVLKIKHGKSQKEIISENGVYPILATGGIIGYTNVALYSKSSVLIGRKGTIDVPKFMDTPFWAIDTIFYSEISESDSSKFIFYLFNQIDWYSYNEASGVPSLSAKTIEKIEHWFPPLKEQTRIATILTDIDRDIEALERKIAKYKALKTGLMQNLLTGKIRLPEEEEEIVT